MTVDWNRELLGQFALEWNLAHGPALETLTDEESLWEPVPGCGSIRSAGPGGRGEFDQAWPDPEPAPVTTIAWRLSHLAVGVFGLRASHHFGDGSLTHENAQRPLTDLPSPARRTRRPGDLRRRAERAAQFPPWPRILAV